MKLSPSCRFAHPKEILITPSYKKISTLAWKKNSILLGNRITFFIVQKKFKKVQFREQMALIDGWLKRLKKSTYDYERISTFDASLLFWHTFYALLFNLYNTMCILSTCWGYVSYISYMWHAINFFRKTDILKQGSIKALDEKYGQGFLASPKINFILFL